MRVPRITPPFHAGRPTWRASLTGQCRRWPISASSLPNCRPHPSRQAISVPAGPAVVPAAAADALLLRACGSAGPCCCSLCRSQRCCSQLRCRCVCSLSCCRLCCRSPRRCAACCRSLPGCSSCSCSPFSRSCAASSGGTPSRARAPHCPPRRRPSRRLPSRGVQGRRPRPRSHHPQEPGRHRGPHLRAVQALDRALDLVRDLGLGR